MTTTDLAATLPAPDQLRRTLKALAALQGIAVASNSWDFHGDRYDAHWGPGEERYDYSNGCGDTLSVTFAGEEVFVRGFSHESDVSPFDRRPLSVEPGILDGLPESLSHLTTEPCDQIEDAFLVTFALWWTPSAGWQHGIADFTDLADRNDGSTFLASHLVDPREGLLQILWDMMGEASGFPLDPSDEERASMDAQAGRVADHLLAGRPLDHSTLNLVAPGAPTDRVKAELGIVSYPVDL